MIIYLIYNIQLNVQVIACVSAAIKSCFPNIRMEEFLVITGGHLSLTQAVHQMQMGSFNTSSKHNLYYK